MAVNLSDLAGKFRPANPDNNSKEFEDLATQSTDLADLATVTEPQETESPDLSDLATAPGPLRTDDGRFEIVDANTVREYWPDSDELYKEHTGLYGSEANLPGDQHGNLAKHRLHALLNKGDIKVEESLFGRSKFLDQNNQLVNAQLVREGLARPTFEDGVYPLAEDAELAARAYDLGLLAGSTTKALKAQEPGEAVIPVGSELERGLLKGSLTVQATHYGLLGMVANILGSDSISQWALNKVDEKQEQSSKVPLVFTHIADITPGEDAMDVLAGAIGTGFPSLLAGLAAGGGAGIAGRAVLARSLRETLTKRVGNAIAGRQWKRETVYRAVNRALRKPEVTEQILKIATAGAFAGSFAQNAGATYTELVERSIEDPFTAVTAGTAMAVLDTFAMTRLIKGVFPNVAPKLAKSWVRAVAKGLGKQTLIEGSTEAAQEVIGITAVALRDPTFDPFDPDNRSDDRILDALAIGGLLGAITGGVGGSARYFLEAPERRRLAEEQNELKRVFRELAEAGLPDDADSEVTTFDYTPEDSTEPEFIIHGKDNTVGYTLKEVQGFDSQTEATNFRDQARKEDPGSEFEVVPVGDKFAVAQMLEVRGAQGTRELDFTDLAGTPPVEPRTVIHGAKNTIGSDADSVTAWKAWPDGRPSDSAIKALETLQQTHAGANFELVAQGNGHVIAQTIEGDQPVVFDRQTQQPVLYTDFIRQRLARAKQEGKKKDPNTNPNVVYLVDRDGKRTRADLHTLVEMAMDAGQLPEYESQNKRVRDAMLWLRSELLAEHKLEIKGLKRSTILLNRKVGKPITTQDLLASERANQASTSTETTRDEELDNEFRQYLLNSETSEAQGNETGTSAQDEAYKREQTRPAPRRFSERGPAESREDSARVSGPYDPFPIRTTAGVRSRTGLIPPFETWPNKAKEAITKRDNPQARKRRREIKPHRGVRVRRNQSVKRSAAEAAIIEKALKLVGVDPTNVFYVDEDGMYFLIEERINELLNQGVHVDSLFDDQLLQTLLDTETTGPQIHGRVILHKQNRYVFVSGKLAGAKKLDVLSHELGHLVAEHYVLGLPDTILETLLSDFYGQAIDAKGDREALLTMAKDIEFQEWFANSFVSWLSSDKTAQTEIADYVTRELNANPAIPKGHEFSALYHRLFKALFAKLKRLYHSLKRQFNTDQTINDFFTALAVIQPGSSPAVQAGTQRRQVRKFVQQLSDPNAGAQTFHYWRQTKSFNWTPPRKYFGNVSAAVKAQLNQRLQQYETYGKLKDGGKQLVETLQALHRLVTGSADGNLNQIAKLYDSAAVRTLAKHFRIRAGDRPLTSSADTQTPFHIAVRKQLAIFSIKAQQILRDMDDATREAVQAEMRANDIAAWNILKKYRRLHRNTGRDYEQDIQSELADLSYTHTESVELRNLYDEVWQYLRQSGVPVGYLPFYLPRIVNRELLMEDPQAFKDMLRANGYSAEAADQAYRKILGEGIDFNQSMLDEDVTLIRGAEAQTNPPANAFVRSRTMYDLPDDALEPFLERDIRKLTENYIHSAAKLGEWNKRLGSHWHERDDGRIVWRPTAKYDSLINGARAEGVPENEIQRIHQIRAAYLGHVGLSFPNNVRKAMSVMLVYMNMLTLLYTVPASLPDIAGIVIRDGSLRHSWNVFVREFREIADSKSAHNEIMRTYSIIHDKWNEHVLSDFFDTHYTSPGVDKWNNAFFTYTGLKWWTNFTRSAAGAVAQDHIQRLAARNDNEALAQLGLSAEIVNRWIANGRMIYGMGDNTVEDVALGRIDLRLQDLEDAQKISNAVTRFVDEAVMRPNATQRPVWASHPAWMLVWHLKSFMYSFQATILHRLWYNLNNAGSTKQATIVALHGMMLLPIAAFGLEIRDFIQYGGGRNPRDNMDAWEYMFEVLERTGGLGLLQMGVDFMDAPRRNQIPILALLGPSLNWGAEVIINPATMRQVVPKSIPVMSQIRPLRDAYREALDAISED